MCAAFTGLGFPRSHHQLRLSFWSARLCLAALLLFPNLLYGAPHGCFASSDGPSFVFLMQDGVKEGMLSLMLHELRRLLPGCGIAVFASEADVAFYEGMDFVADPDDVRAMAIVDTDTPFQG